MRHFKLLIFCSILFFVGLPHLQAQSDRLLKLRELRDKGSSVARLEYINQSLPTAAEAEKPLFLMEKARILEADGKKAEALEAYLQISELKSNLTEYALFFAAKLQLEANQPELAAKTWNQVLAMSPNLQMQNESRMALARIALAQGKGAEARKQLQGLERKLRSEAVHSDILWDLARSERIAGNKTNTCKWLKKLFVEHPEFEKIKEWGPDLAQQNFEGKQSGCAMSMEDRRKRIKNLQWAGLSKKAWDEIEALQKLPGESAEDVKMLEASFHLHEGEVSDALKALLPLYEKKKNDFSYLTTLATAAARSGESQLAVGSYYNAYKLSPKSKLGKQALYQSAFLSYQFQDYDGASRRFQEFMKKYSNSGLAKDAKWHLAWIRYLRGDYAGASQSLAQLLARDRRGQIRRGVAGTDRISYWMAMSLFRQGQYPEAKAALEKLAKENRHSYYGLAALYRLKKIETLLPRKLAKGSANEKPPSGASSADRSLADSSGADAIESSAESSESEESMVLSPLSSETEVAEKESEEGNAEPALAGESDESKSSFSNPVLMARFERAKDLMTLGQNDWAKWDLYEIERKTSNKDYLKRLMSEYEAIGQYHRSAAIAQNAFAGLRTQKGLDGVRQVWQFAYPQAYKDSVKKWSTEFQVPFELIWGIMKAESSFKRDVVSPVGAIGLMQIMPNTGEKLTGLLKEKGFQPQQLFEPNSSIRLGSKYLQRLLRQFDYNYALVAAGYNAGPHRVRGWLATFGQLDLDEFIEHIPFLETRNYVKRVLSNSAVYSQLYNGVREQFPALADPLKIRFQTVASNKETWEDI